MERLQALAWIAVIVAAVGLFLWFNEPVEEVLLGFDVTNSSTAAEVEFLESTLEQYNATATFFLAGNWAQEHRNLTLRLAARHEVACHTMTAPRLPELDEERLEEEIIACRALLENITGEEIIGFRAPGLLIDERTFALLWEQNFTYDASTLEKLGWFTPPPTIEELPVSTIAAIPTPWFRILGDLGYFLMRQDKDARVSLSLKPEHVSAHRGAFQYLVSSYADDEVAFLAHEAVLQ